MFYPIPLSIISKAKPYKALEKRVLRSYIYHDVAVLLAFQTWANLLSCRLYLQNSVSLRGSAPET